MSGQYAKTADLPAAVQSALTAVGYARKDIRVEASERVQLSTAVGDGHKAYVALVNLTTGQHTIHWGSWGGQNMFVRTAVDEDRRTHALPGDGVAITGSIGGGKPVYAVLRVPASMVARMLPGPAVALTTEEQNALYCYASVRGGKYRSDAIDRLNVKVATIDAMVDRGYLKRARNGATQITTDGKNVVSDYRPSYGY